MKFKIKSLLFLGIIGIMTISACKKENVSLETHIAEIPVSVSDVIGYYSTPTVQTTLLPGTIKIVLNIPASSGRTIKEITRVGVGTSVNSVQITTGLYNTAPIQGNGTTAVTFNTNLEAYATIVGPLVAPGLPVPVGGLAASFLPRNFYFMLTLDNGDVIFTTSVRVYVAKSN